MPRTTQPPSKSIGSALKTLKRIAILKDLPAEAVDELEAACRWREFAANEQIIDRTDTSGDVFFVVRGSVRVVNYSATGRQVGFADFESGNVVGELSAIDGEARSADVFAQKRTVLAIIERSAFTELLKRHPEIPLRMLVHLARVIRKMNERVLDLSALSDVQRVYYELLRLSEPNPQAEGSWLIYNMPRHKELADLVGTSAEIVAHAISQLMKAELAKRRSGSLELVNRDKIRQLAIMD